MDQGELKKYDFRSITKIFFLLNLRANFVCKWQFSNASKC